MEAAMIKTTYFMDHPGYGWPDKKWLAPYFLTPAGRQTAFGKDNDSWSVTAECVDGTESLPREQQIDIDLYIIGKPDLGVLLFYDRWSATDGVSYYSKGNLRMLRQWIVTRHRTRLPVGLFIPFEQALKALVEFTETDGALPKCIEWVASSDLPEGTFPEPVVTIRDAQVSLGDS
jgi:Immunity protein Imm1